MFRFKKFYKGLSKRRNHLDNYLDRYPRNEKKYKKEIISLLNENYINEDSVSLEHTLTVSYLDGVDSDYTDILLALLSKDWHILHEDIVMNLELVKDPKSINLLYERALNIPEEDEFRSLAKKCIWALGAIKSDDSIEKLKLLSKSEDSIIREVAMLQINYNN